MAQTRKIPIKSICLNTGQINGVKKNPRLIKDAKYEKLKQSIEENPEMLELRELLVYPFEGKYVCIGGNMRFRACKELGYDEVPCKVIPETATPEQLNAYIIKDNSGFGEWDFDMLANEWDVDSLDKWGVDIPDWGIKDKEEAQEDGYGDEEIDDAPTRSKVGDIWQLGDHRLMCGDSTKGEDVSALMNGVEADLFLTDPPYNVNYEGRTKDKLKIANDNMEISQFQDFLAAAFSCANDHMRKGAAFYIWHADSEGFNFRAAVKRVNWALRETLIWVKNSLVMGRQDYQWKHEPCLYGWKDGAAHYFIDDRTLTTTFEEEQSQDYTKMKKEDLVKMLRELSRSKTPATVVYEDKPQRNDIHPTMKPVKLMSRLIINSSKKGWKVLDLFGGSGSTLVACEQLGRTCYTMEYDPRYCDAIIDRWEKLTGNEAKRLVEGGGTSTSVEDK